MNIKFDPYAMYSFDYAPISPKSVLPVYDAHPLIFILDITKKSILGLNIHWIDKKYRREFISDVKYIMAQTETIQGRKKRARLTYNLIQKPQYKKAMFGIRRYIVKQISNIQAIPEKAWKHTLQMKRFHPNYEINKNARRITNEDLSKFYIM